ncbi:MAG: caspase family protein, partial [Gemmataceae bacterium]
MPRSAAALLVGIGAYQNADRIDSLRYSPRDAHALARMLADPDVCDFPRDAVKLLTDDKAGKRRIVRALSEWLPAQADGVDVAFVYFAGHGVVEHDEGYLLPHDAHPDKVVSQGISMSDLGRWIARLNARAVVVCLDCCHAGGVLPPDGLSLRGERDLRIQPSMLARLAGQNRFLLASCGRGEKSIEAQELKHGLFTYHLLRGLEGAADRDGDGRVGLAELFGYVAAAVKKEAKERFGLDQVPWASAVYTEDVILSTPRAGRPESTQTHDPPTGVPADPTLDRLLRLRRQPDAAEVPFVFGSLAHES